MEELKKSPHIIVAEPNLIGRVSYEPNDPYFKGTSPATYPHQWALKNTGQTPPTGTNDADIDITEAWDISKGTSDIIIAILDSCIPLHSYYYTPYHPDLDDPNKIILGSDFIDRPGTIYYTEGVRDRYGHGTHVAGIAGAESNNGIGIAGIASNCKLLAIQVFDRYGWGTIESFFNGVVQAVNYQRNNPGKKVVINFSGGFWEWAETIESAVAYANAYNVLIIASAGNMYGDTVLCPAELSSNYPNVIAVSSTDANDLFSVFSSQCSEVCVSAPGGFGVEQVGNTFYYNNTSLLGKNIFATTPNYEFNMAIDPYYENDPYSTDITQNYSYVAGTSMSAPIVSGIAALILSVNPNLNPSQIRLIIEQSAEDKGYQGFDNYYGYGRVNAYQALLLALANFNKSVNQTGTGSNNARKLVKETTSNYHLVFSSGGEIFYRKTTDAGNNWLTPIRLSTGNGNNNYPSISESSGRLYVTWQRNTSSNNYDIYFAASTNAGSNWNIKYVLNSVTVSTDPLPSIQAASTYEMIVFRYGSGIKSYWSYYTTPTDQSYWVVRTTGFSTSYSPSVTSAFQSPTYYFPMVMSNSSDNHIYYYYFDTYTSNWAGGPNNLSSIMPGSNSIHITPSITSIPGTSQVHVAWKKLIGSGSTIYDHLIIHRKSTNYNSWPNEWFGTYYNSQEYPSISALATNKVDLLYHTPSQFGTQYIYKMRFNSSYWGAPTSIASNARYPSVSSGSTTAKYIWTSGSSSPYTVILSSELLQKELELDPLDYYTRSVAWLDSVGSYLEIKLHPIYLTLKDGTKKRIDITPADLETYNLTLSNSWDLLSSVQFEVPSEAVELAFDYSVSGNNIKNLFAESINSVTPAFGLLNEKDEVIAVTTQNHLVDSDKIGEVRKQVSLNLSGLTDQKNTKAVIKLEGLKPREGVFASLGHIEDYSGLPDQYQKQIDLSQEVAEVNEYAISNYPNPFNPSTNIQYSIKEAVFVTLKVYDILGREIATLVNEEKPVGVYTINFNGSGLSSGIYCYRFQAGSFIQTKKMILTK